MSNPTQQHPETRTTSAASYKGLIKRFDQADEDVKKYFAALPDLIRDHVYEISVSYLFFNIERAHRRTLMGGVVKRLCVDSGMAERVVFDWQMTRADFESQFSKVFEQPVSVAALTYLRKAERIRDQVMHGRHPTQSEMRDAISAVIEYAELLNSQVQLTAGFRPFGSMQGYKGAKLGLDKATSRWVLKGLGFPIS